MGSSVTPSQQVPKVSVEGSQDRDLVNASPKDVSLEPLSLDQNLLKASTKDVSLEPRLLEGQHVQPLSKRARLAVGKSLAPKKRKLQKLQNKLSECNACLFDQFSEVEYLKLIAIRQKLPTRISMLAEECADLKRQLNG